ncbi:MAG TPA: hypothetical protein VMU51_10070 [Mycobacteriales bacterium]|nr:hypothetical protein [Mycobacteriales bacterium]
MNDYSGGPNQADQGPPLPHPEARDETTRLLSAAAHLSPRFCTLAIREFLTDPLRAVVPSPGVNDGAVLREAVAARARRRWRDGVLALLLIAFGLLSPTLLAGWIAVAILWSGFGLRRRHLDLVLRRRPGAGTYVGALIAFSLVAARGATALRPGGTTGSNPDLGDFSSDQPTQQVSGGVSIVIALLIGLVIAGVLITDRLLIWSLLTKSFRRGRFSATPKPGEWLRTMGSGSAAGRLLQQRSAIPRGNTVVYLDENPFVGSGTPSATWSIAIPLEAADQPNGNGATPQPPKRPPTAFPLLDLYDHIGGYLSELRRSLPALSPSYRLSELREFETLFVPAVDLVTHFGGPAASLVLPRPDQPPLSRIDPQYVKQVAEQPIEWLRYYRGFQVEAWDRDLVVSVFLHVGADRDMLYFECTPCVLAPIYSGYWAIDLLSERTRLAPIMDAIGSTVVLPISIVGRLRHAFRPTKPAAPDKEYTADRYGARYSLRELVAQDTLTDYLKIRDVDRYLMLMQDRIFKATAEFLDARGISSKVFREKANIIQNNAYNNFDQRNSNFSGSMFGTLNVNHNNPAPAQPASA